MTGFSRQVRDIVTERAQDHCEACGVDAPQQYHHRRARGMGSTKNPEANLASNCLFISAHCHQFIESQRALALDRGWLIRQGQNPAQVPVLRHGSDWVLLLEDGGVFVPPRGKGRCERCGFHVVKQGHRNGCQMKGRSLDGCQ